jgi:hypothetical protein
MLEALSTPRNRTVMLVFLGVSCACAIGAAVVGVSDNPPGILLAFLAATAFILAFVHPWRNSKQFRYLFYASGLGFIVFGVLHNVLEVVAEKFVSSGLLHGLLHGLLQGLSVTFFLAAILICPPGLLVGAVGSVVMFIRNRRRRAPGNGTAA